MILREPKGSSLKYLTMLLIEIENIFLMMLIKFLMFGNEKNPKIHERL